MEPGEWGTERMILLSLCIYSSQTGCPLLPPVTLALSPSHAHKTLKFRASFSFSRLIILKFHFSPLQNFLPPSL